MNAAIVGSGIAGMSAALYLAKAGHDVTLFERDGEAPPDSAAQAFEWDRRGAPQVRHSHAMLARMRNLLLNDHPEIHDALLAAGATEMKLYQDMPGYVGDDALGEDDLEIVMLACRRATLEWVLRSAAMREARITIRVGATIEGLLFDDDEKDLVRGLRVADGPDHPADLVIVADGRRSSVPGWLEGAGLPLEEDAEEPAGIVYFSRFYKLDEGRSFPTTSLVANDLGFLFYAAFCGDNGYFSVALSANEDDTELRRALKDPEFYERAVRLIPDLSPWIECGTPTTDVFPMAGLVNRRRSFLRGDEPLVRGLHVIGDAHVCTNPAYGRGVSLAMWQARLLADAIAEHPSDLRSQSRAFCRSIEKEVVPWFDISVFMDSGRRAERERLANAGDAHAPAENPMQSLHEAASSDPDVWRTFWRAMNLLEPPSALMSPEFLGRIAAVSAAAKEPDASGPGRDTGAVELPDRDTLLGMLTANAS